MPSLRKLTNHLIGTALIVTLPLTVVAENEAGTAEENALKVAAGTNRFARSFSPARARDVKIVDATRKAWIRAQVSKLEDFQPSGDNPPADIKTYDDGLVLYWVEKEAFLQFSDDEWLYVITHSGHRKNGVGSAILAVDQTGQLYWNEAHVCRRISVVRTDGKSFESVSDFLQHKVEDTDWEPL